MKAVDNAAGRSNSGAAVGLGTGTDSVSSQAAEPGLMDDSIGGYVDVGMSSPEKSSRKSKSKPATKDKSRAHAADKSKVSHTKATHTAGRLERRVKAHPDSHLIQFAKDYTSQGGEDGIIEHIFKNILPPVTQRNQYCVDIGAWDGKHLSNTFTLLSRDGWSGLLVEADPTRNSELRKLYEDRKDIHCIDAFVELTGSNTLVKYLSDYDIPVDFEFLSIDIDGADYYVWKSLQGLSQPKIVCIEFNPTISNRIVFVQEPDSRVHQGSSLLAMVELGKELGYTLLVTTTFNAFFVRNDLFIYFENIVDTSVDDDSTRVTEILDKMNPCSMVTEMFQTYEGELKYVGPLKLLWHRMALNPQKLQVLSKKQRYFPFSPLCADGGRDTHGAVTVDLNHDQAQVVAELKKLLISFACDLKCDCTRDFFNDTTLDDNKTDGTTEGSYDLGGLSDFAEDDNARYSDEFDAVTVRSDDLVGSELHGPGDFRERMGREVRCDSMDSRLSSKHVCSTCANNIQTSWSRFIDACRRILVVSSMQGFCLEAVSAALLQYAIMNRFCGPNLHENPLFEYSNLFSGSCDIRFVSKIQILKDLLFSASEFIKGRGEVLLNSQSEEALELLRVADAVFWLSCQAMINNDKERKDDDNTSSPHERYNRSLSDAIYDSYSGSFGPPSSFLSTSMTPITKRYLENDGNVDSSPSTQALHAECSPMGSMVSFSSASKSHASLSYSEAEKITFTRYSLQFGRLCRIKGSLLECWFWLTKASLYLSAVNAFQLVFDGLPAVAAAPTNVHADDLSKEVTKEWRKLLLAAGKMRDEITALYPDTDNEFTVVTASMANGTRGMLTHVNSANSSETLPRPTMITRQVTDSSEPCTTTGALNGPVTDVVVESSTSVAAATEALTNANISETPTERVSDDKPLQQSVSVDDTTSPLRQGQLRKPAGRAERLYESVRFTSLGLALGVVIGYGLSTLRSKR
jgi:hypothetical protein